MIVDAELMTLLMRTSAVFPVRTADAFRADDADDPAHSRRFGSGALVSWGPGRFVNRAFGVSLDPLDATAIDELEAFFDDAGVPPSIEVCSWASPDLVAALAARRFAPERFVDLLVIDSVATGSSEINPAIAIRPVDDASRDDWRRTFVEAFATNPEDRRLNDELAGVLVHFRDAIHVLASVGGEPAGCGSLYWEGRVGWVGGGATLPHARRQGIQAALLAERITLARELGCDIVAATAVSGSASSRNLQRHGFTLTATVVVMTRV